MPSSPTVGVDDLQSQFPEIAKQAYGWDPRDFFSGSGIQKEWQGMCGHIWIASIYDRTKGRGCPVCAGRQVLVGYNDLKSRFPEIAAQAYNWDPETIVFGSGQKKLWRCEFGHIWEATPNSRTNRKTDGNGCAICAGQKVLVGFNDLKTKYPQIAMQAHEWDPTTVTVGSSQKKQWKCEYGHIYVTTVCDRIKGRGCPVCSGRQLLVGFNDLHFKFPDIALEAYGWDPTTVISGTNQKRMWRGICGHIWEASVKERTSGGSGCPFCSGKRVLAGSNDLASTHPEIALEAYEWDPKTVTSKAGRKRKWMCQKGHIYESLVSNRTNGKGCPFCAGRKVLVGFNDLRTKFPEIAQEAHGWDPTSITSGTSQKKQWKGKCGHIWDASVSSRVNGNGCPVCSNYQVIVGVNDLRTRFPEVAVEAYGWDPTTVSAGSNLKKAWKCSKGHIWQAIVLSRTRLNSGCPSCAEYGYDPSKDAWFYLMHRPGEQQLGITNSLARRMSVHQRNGWNLVEVTGPADGHKVADTEKALKRWLKKEIGLIQGTTENWSTTSMEVHSLAELKKRSGIETDLF